MDTDSDPVCPERLESGFGLISDLIRNPAAHGSLFVHGQKFLGMLKVLIAPHASASEGYQI